MVKYYEHNFTPINDLFPEKNRKLLCKVKEWHSGIFIIKEIETIWKGDYAFNFPIFVAEVPDDSRIEVIAWKYL